MTKCKLPNNPHPVHGECQRHMGGMHVADRDGKTFAWPSEKMPVNGRTDWVDHPIEWFKEDAE